MRLVEGRGLPERFAWQQRLVSTATRCRPAPPSARCTLWPRHWTRTERREDSLWTGSSNMKTPTWPHPPCKTQTHTGVTHRCVFAWSCDHSAPCVFQCEGRHQQGGPGDPGVLQSQSQAGGVPWRVQQHTHTLLTSLPVLSSSLFPVAVISEVWRCFYLPDVTQWNAWGRAAPERFLRNGLAFVHVYMETPHVWSESRDHIWLKDVQKPRESVWSLNTARAWAQTPVSWGRLYKVILSQ